jgi:hypothetical protein
LLTEAQKVGKKGIWLKMWRKILSQQDAQATPVGANSFLHRSFDPAKKVGSVWGKRGKGSKGIVLVEGSGIALGSQITSASPAEVKLAESTLDRVVDRVDIPRSG